MAWSPALAFTDGDIEFDVRGRDIPGHSFVGIAFHIISDTSFDAVYLRPFNFQAADSARRAHAVQFVSSPAYPWDRLRAEQPGVFEKPVPASLDPAGWIHVRVRVRGPAVDVYLNGADTPVLIDRQSRVAPLGRSGLFRAWDIGRRLSGSGDPPAGLNCPAC
jgi:hypothetical protein